MVSLSLNFTTMRLAYKLRVNAALGEIKTFISLIKNGNRKLYSEITAIAKLSRVVWVPILIGYLIVILSFFMGFEPPSSGAVLVGTCILAELGWARMAWRRGAMFFGTELIHLTDEESPSSLSSTGGRSISGVSKELILLMQIAKEKSLSRDKKMWSISTSLDRFDATVTGIIGVSGIMGTLIWGYAHLL